LQDYGFRADQKPILQNRRVNFHKHIALRLLHLQQAYVCKCSRKQLVKYSTQGTMGAIYPGICRNKNLPFSYGFNIRAKTQHNSIEFTDGVFGPQYFNLENESGDYVIYRGNDLPSFILASSADDAHEKYTEVVRGADLLAITSRQIHLTNLIGLKTPSFMHIPIITNDSGGKLSKQTHAPALGKYHARSLLVHSLTDLGQDPPRWLYWRPVWAIWDWAITHWRPNKIPSVSSIPLNF